MLAIGAHVRKVSPLNHSPTYANREESHDNDVPTGQPRGRAVPTHPGRAHLTGIQALARLPIDQARRDRQSGARVASYISGYEGSPLAGYDLELGRQTGLLDQHDIVFEPGLNEEAAAMAVQGSQLAAGQPMRFDGVVGYWYGKGPGLDRASDACGMRT